MYLIRRKHEISIHAPREGSDEFGNRYRNVDRISIHAPREGSDYEFLWFRFLFVNMLCFLKKSKPI